MMVTGNPPPSMASLTRVGAVVPSARPIDTLMVVSAVGAAALAGLLMIRIWTGSAPVSLGPVQVTVLPDRLMTLSLPAPVTQRSRWLLAPGLPGAPVT